MQSGLWPRQVGSVLLVFFALTGGLRAERPAPLARLQFLAGEWEGIGDQAGATGGFTFAPSVQDRIIVRTNHSITPGTGGTPGSRHDDLMVIYVEADLVKADYFDSEGHVIRYLADARPGEVMFVSEIRASEPRYRLTYRQGPSSTLTGTFEVAPPGTPDAFGLYLSWTARKLK
jgi:hypothetical protein